MGKAKFFKIWAQSPRKQYSDIFQDYNVQWAISQFKSRYKDDKMICISYIQEYVNDDWQAVTFTV